MVLVQIQGFSFQFIVGGCEGIYDLRYFFCSYLDLGLGLCFVNVFIFMYLCVILRKSFLNNFQFCCG